MKRDPSRLSESTFDLLIVGGGIVGAGIAWDASLRGLSCALVEQGDFAGGTSSKTTKLIHGGIRYLEQLEFRLVRQAVQERALLLKNAPHLVKPLSFLIPRSSGAPRPWPILRLGVFLYDLLAGKAVIQPHRVVKAGLLYTDAQMDDSRLVLEVLQAASEAGASAVNHCPVVRFLTENGRVAGAVVQDRLTGDSLTVRARCVINAAGPWVDSIRRLADPDSGPLIRPSKGIHLVYPDLGLKQALLLSAQDRRIFFLIPWRGLTLIGTTDTDYSGDPGQAKAEAEDVEYLIRETNRILPHLQLKRENLISTFAGVRPLILQEKKDPWSVSRSHRVHEDPNGLFSVLGGKFTTFRRIAEDVVDLVLRKFPEKSFQRCRTKEASLSGASEARKSKIQEWLRSDPALVQPLCPHHPFTPVDVRYAVEEEMAITLSDLLWRRLPMGHSLCHGLDALEPAAKRMGDLLGWSGAERRDQVERYNGEVSAACL